jgi:hypothetical protein
MGLLDGGLRDEIGNDGDIRSIMLRGTLTTNARSLVNGRMVSTPTQTPVMCFFDNRRVGVMGDSQRVCVILGITEAGDIVPPPRDGDKVELQGETITVLRCEIDPAGATYTLVAKETGA